MWVWLRHNAPPILAKVMVPYVVVRSDFVVSLTNISTRSSSNTSNASVAFLCSTSTENGLDLPLLSWYKDGTLLQINDGRISYFQNVYGLTTLFISEVEKSDEGHYSCRGSNQNGTIESGAELKVVGKHEVP